MTATTVLLPVRIETVLDTPTGANGPWVLRFRLIPDAVSIIPADSGATEQHLNAQATRDWSSQVAGFPPTILVRVERVGLPPEDLTLHVIREALTLPSVEADLAEASSEEWDPAATDRRANPGPWWLTYSGAVAVGLGGEIPLGADRGEIVAVYAVGLGSDLAEGVLAAHAARERLSRVPVGTATNAVAGDTPAQLAKVSEAAAGAVLDVEPNTRRGQVTIALWSALFGDALVDVFGAPRDRVDALAEWCADWLAPDGMRSAIAIRDVPYGVFATTDLQRLEPMEGDPRSTEVAQVICGLVGLLATRAEQRPHAPSQVDDLVERLGQQASSGRFRLRAARDVAGAPADAAYTAAVHELDALGIVPAAVHPLPDAASEPYPRAVFVGDDQERDYLERMTSALAATLEDDPIIVPPEELPNPARSCGLFIKVLDRSIRAEVAKNSPAAIGRLKTVLELLDSIVVGREFGGLESGTCGLIDAAGQRIDPWAVAIAEQRWAEAGGGAASPLGLYGWVDGPIVPADLRGAFTLAPSVPQATVAAIALDRHLTDGDPDPDRWRMALDSASIRTAEEIGAELQAGNHLSEAVGRLVEQHAPEKLRQDLRYTYPRDAVRPEQGALDGMKVLAAWKHTRDLGVGAIPSTVEKALDRMAAGVDTYADLLVLNALKKVVDGRPDLAKADLDAAAGLSAPPSFDVLRTPRSVRDARTIVLATVPFVESPHAPSSAYAAADPSMSAYLNGLVDPEDLVYEFTIAGGKAMRATLSDLGVDVATAAVIPPPVLDRAVRQAYGLGGDDALDEPSQLADVRRRARAMAGSLPEAESSQLEAVDDRAELITRLLAALAMAHDLINAGLERPAAQFERRRRLLGFGLSLSRDEDYELAVAELSARADDALAVANDPTATPSGIAAALRSLLGGSDTTMPISRGASVPKLKPATDQALRDWLSTVSALRSRVAALDVEALASADVQVATSSTDPWQREDDPTRTLFVSLAPKGFLGGRAAVSIVDSFAESLPARGHDAGMAFHFDAPTARAPQAILLAVPGDPGLEEMSPLDALSIVQATRQLAHARMFQLRDDPVIAAVAPTALFPWRSELPDGRLP